MANQQLCHGSSSYFALLAILGIQHLLLHGNLGKHMFRGILDRQAGSGVGTSPSAFHLKAGRSLDLIHRLQLDRKLDGHEGCVNTVSFTPSGDRLVSGSDDLYINTWDWQTGSQHVGQLRALKQACVGK